MKLLLPCIAVIIFTSCTTPRYAYSPSAHNVPVFTGRGDSKVAANFSANGDLGNGGNQYHHNRSNGYDLQGAVAVTNRLGVQASYFSRKEIGYDNFNGSYDSSVVRHKRNLFEVGAGYFVPIDKKNKVMFQMYAGVGLGKLAITDDGSQGVSIYNRFYNADIIKYYLEPTIIFKNKDIFAASLSTRFSVINFKKIRTNYSFDEKQQYKLDSLNRYASVFFEPAFVNSYGFKGLPGFRIEYQVGLSLGLSTADYFDYRPFNFSVGLLFDIPKLIRGKENHPNN